MINADQRLRVARRPDPLVEGAPPRGRGRAARRARLVVRHVSPLSVLRLSVGVAVSACIVAIVGVAVLYTLLDSMGVFTSVSHFTNDIGATHVQPHFIGLGTVVRWTALVSAGVGVFGVAMATVAAYLYNVISDAVGGPVVTLAESHPQ